MAIRRTLGICLAVCAWCYGMNVRSILILGAFILVTLFVIVPSLFRWCTYIQRHMVFLPWVKWPKNVDFNHPEWEGLTATNNFYLRTSAKIEVGVWHILPKSLIDKGEGKDEDWYRAQLGTGIPIVLYMHGNTGSRARDHRVEVYKVLRNLDYHVIAFDYRGYADSSPAIPTKTGVVEDAHKVYEYIKANADGSPIFVYGHSLGTAVSTQVVADLSKMGSPPKALILESPFNNIHDEIRKHPMTFLWRKMPWFDWFFSGTLTRNDVGFVTDQCIEHIQIPILIFHAEDDLVVPFELGKRLFLHARSRRPADSKPVLFVPFSADLGLGHIYIYASPSLSTYISLFINKTLKDDWTSILDFEAPPIPMEGP